MTPRWDRLSAIPRHILLHRLSYIQSEKTFCFCRGGHGDEATLPGPLQRVFVPKPARSKHFHRIAAVRLLDS